MADIGDIVSNKIQLYLSAAAHLVDSSLFLSFRTYKYLGYFQLSTVAQAARPPDTFPVLTRAPLPDRPRLLLLLPILYYIWYYKHFGTSLRNCSIKADH